MSNSTIDEIITQLKKNGFSAYFYSNRKQAVESILKSIPVTAVVGRCGSTTCSELKLFELLAERGTRIIDPYTSDKTPEEKDSARRQILLADVLLTGTNAITEDGKLVNIDGVGNRVAAQIFGPKKTIIVAGKNKIVKNFTEAIKRIKREACPKNARRLGLTTPCSQDIPCPQPDGCNSPQRMCNVTVVIERKPRLSEIEIHLIDEILGF